MLSFMIINSKEMDNTANSTLAMRHTRSQNTLDICVPNWKSSHDVMFIHAWFYIFCIASLGIFYKGVSWNSRFLRTDHVYDIIGHR